MKVRRVWATLIAAVLVLCSVGCAAPDFVEEVILKTEAAPEVQTEEPDALEEIERLVELFAGEVPDAPGYKRSVLNDLRSMLRKLDEKGISGRMLDAGEKYALSISAKSSIAIEMDNGDLLICLLEPKKAEEYSGKHIEEEATRRGVHVEYIFDVLTDKIHYVVLAEDVSLYKKDLLIYANAAPDRPPVEEFVDFD